MENITVEAVGKYLVNLTELQMTSCSLLRNKPVCLWLIKGDNIRSLYSNILSVRIQEGQATIDGTFVEYITDSDSVWIYLSKASLEALDFLVESHYVQHISPVFGMYHIEGIPKGTYRTALATNEKRRDSSVGEIRMKTEFKYHGKLHVILKYNIPKSSILGSANLGVIKQEVTDIRLYEVSSITEYPLTMPKYLISYVKYRA